MVIDQFEELFTLCADEAARRASSTAWSSRGHRPRSRVRVVVTLRADFYDRPLRYPELRRAARAVTIAVDRMSPDELERAIVEPAAAGRGARSSPGSWRRSWPTSRDQPGALPLLQYALTELYERRSSGAC